MENPSSNVVTDKQKEEGQEMGISINEICQLLELNKCEQGTPKVKPSNSTKITENHSKESAVVINLINVNNFHSDNDTKSEGCVTKQDGKKRGWHNISYVGSLKQKQERPHLNLCTANEHGKFKDAELTGSGRAQASHSDSDTKSEGDVTKQDGKKRGWDNISYVGSLKQKQERPHLNLSTANEHGKFKDAELTGSGRAHESGMNNLRSVKVPNRKLSNWERLEVQAQKDPDLLFFRSILPDMKQMTDKQKRKFKKKILGAVEEILKN